jgi:arylsulfatase A-like enzyme
VPFVVRWPEKVKADTTSDQVTCLTDLMATAADILDQPLADNAGVDSVSMLPALLGEADGQIREATVHHSINGSFAIRQGDWKLALCPGSGGWSAPKPNSKAERNLPDLQLFNLRDDVAEENNVQADHSEIVEQLTALMKQYIEKGRSTPGPAQPNDTDIKLIKPRKK